MPENPHAEHLEELLEGLNEPQREAVTHGEGPLLILAGAGSGKTRVLTHRIAFLIYTDQAQPGEILAITFTNKAASEMRNAGGRAARPRHPWHVGDDLPLRLREDPARRGAPPRLHAAVHDLRPGRRAAPDQALARRRSAWTPSATRPASVHNQISAVKNQLLDAATYRESAAGPYEEMVADVYELYERDLHRMNAMDFDDLLFRTVNLLELFDDVRERYVAGLPPRARGRVPGHQPRPVPAAAAARRGRSRPRPPGAPARASRQRGRPPTRRRSGTATSRWSATTRSRSTASAAPTSATSSTSSRTSPTRA